MRLSELIDYVLTVLSRISPPPEWFTGWIELALAMLSVVISYLLYRLYRQQKKLLAADHKAIVSARLVDSESITSTIELKNSGNGVAKNIKLVTYFTIPDEYENKYAEVGVYLNKDGEEGIEGAVLQSGEKGEFNCKPKIGVKETDRPEGWDTKWLLEAFDEMKEDGIEEVKYCFVVEYTEFTEESQTVIVTPFVASLNPQNERYDGYPTGLEVAATGEQEATDVFTEELSEHIPDITRRDRIRLWLRRAEQKIK